MTFRIEIESDQLTETEARAIVALFRQLHPSIADFWTVVPGNDEPDLFAGLSPIEVGTKAHEMAEAHLQDRPAPYVSAAATVNDPAAVFGDPAALYTALGGVLPADPPPLPTLSPEEAFGAPPLADGAASVAPPAPAAAPATVTLDRRGLPWDKRIHSTPAKFIASGEWRKKKGVSADTIATVEAELCQIMTANPVPVTINAPVTPGPAPVSPPAPSPTVPSPPPAPSDTAPSGFPTSIAPPPPAPPAPPAGIAPTAPPATQTSPSNAQLFAALMKRINISENRADNPLTVQEREEALQGCELTKLPDFLRRPDLIPQFEMILGDRLAPAPVA